MEYCATLFTVDMIPHYLVKAVILEILVASMLHSALGAGMFTVSRYQIGLFTHLSSPLLLSLFAFAIFPLTALTKASFSFSAFTSVLLRSNSHLYSA